MNVTESQGKVRREDHGTRECLKYKNARVSQKIRGRDRIRTPPPPPSFTLLLCYPATFFVNELLTSSVSGTLKKKRSVYHQYITIQSFVHYLTLKTTSIFLVVFPDSFRSTLYSRNSFS